VERACTWRREGARDTVGGRRRHVGGGGRWILGVLVLVAVAVVLVLCLLALALLIVVAAAALDLVVVALVVPGLVLGRDVARQRSRGASSDGF